MAIGAFCYAFWILGFLLPAFYKDAIDSGKTPSGILDKNVITVVILVTAFINGVGAGLLWVSQGKYMSDCACTENQGFFTGYFWAFFMGSQLVGNIIAGFVLRSGGSS